VLNEASWKMYGEVEVSILVFWVITLSGLVGTFQRFITYLCTTPQVGVRTQKTNTLIFITVRTSDLTSADLTLHIFTAGTRRRLVIVSQPVLLLAAPRQDAECVSHMAWT
jgi:hypothetical protein